MTTDLDYHTIIETTTSPLSVLKKLRTAHTDSTPDIQDTLSLIYLLAVKHTSVHGEIVKYIGNDIVEIIKADNVNLGSKFKKPSTSSKKNKKSSTLESSDVDNNAYKDNNDYLSIMQWAAKIVLLVLETAKKGTALRKEALDIFMQVIIKKNFNKECIKHNTEDSDINDNVKSHNDETNMNSGDVVYDPTNLLLNMLHSESNDIDDILELICTYKSDIVINMVKMLLKDIKCDVAVPKGCVSVFVAFCNYFEMHDFFCLIENEHFYMRNCYLEILCKKTIEDKEDSKKSDKQKGNNLTDNRSKLNSKNVMTDDKTFEIFIERLNDINYYVRAKSIFLLGVLYNNGNLKERVNDVLYAVGKKIHDKTVIVRKRAICFCSNFLMVNNKEIGGNVDYEGKENNNITNEDNGNNNMSLDMILHGNMQKCTLLLKSSVSSEITEILHFIKLCYFYKVSGSNYAFRALLDLVWDNKNKKVLLECIKEIVERIDPILFFFKFSSNKKDDTKKNASSILYDNSNNNSKESFRRVIQLVRFKRHWITRVQKDFLQGEYLYESSFVLSSLRSLTFDPTFVSVAAGVVLYALQYTSERIDTNYKYQFKRQASEQFTLTKKRNLTKLNQLQQQLNSFSNNKIKMPFSYSTPNQGDNINSEVQSTNYVMSEVNAKNNQLVTYKKYFGLSQQPHQHSKVTDNDLIQQQQQLKNEMKIEEPTLMSDIMQPQSISQQSTISTQVDEQELYNMFEGNTNQLAYNNTSANEIYLKNNTMINYSTSTNESAMANMCNVNTQMPSIPPSPIISKDDPFANQFNQMISDKVDFNNNNLATSTLSYPPFNEEQQIVVCSCCCCAIFRKKSVNLHEIRNV